MADAEDEKTRLIRRAKAQSDTAPTEPILNQPTRMLDGTDDESAGGDPDTTQLVGPARRATSLESSSSSTVTDGGELDPVVGWLVVLAGPGRGNARRLGYGQNSLGRDRSERVSLDFGDASVSRTKHCFVLYEPRKRQYYLRPGDGANLTYLNGELLAESKLLNPADVIEIGATRLRFVALCGPEFDWEDSAPAAK